MFSPELLSLNIAGKRFSRDDKYDKALFYGKDYFSNYVYAHYKEIDFSKFIPLLDALNGIVINGNTISSSNESVSLAT